MSVVAGEFDEFVCGVFQRKQKLASLVLAAIIDKAQKALFADSLLFDE